MERDLTGTYDEGNPRRGKQRERALIVERKWMQGEVVVSRRGERFAGSPRGRHLGFFSESAPTLSGSRRAENLWLARNFWLPGAVPFLDFFPLFICLFRRLYCLVRHPAWEPSRCCFSAASGANGGEGNTPSVRHKLRRTTSGLCARGSSWKRLAFRNALRDSSLLHECRHLWRSLPGRALASHSNNLDFIFVFLAFIFFPRWRKLPHVSKRTATIHSFLHTSNCM